MNKKHSLRLSYLLSFVLFSPWFLFSCSSSHNHIATELAKPFPVDINQHSIFIRPGFDRSWINIWPQALPEAEKLPWKEFSGTANGFRLLQFPQLEFPEVAKPSPPALLGVASQAFTYNSRFNIAEEAFDRVFSAGLLLAAIGSNYEIFLNGHSLIKEMRLDEQGNILESRERRNLLIPIDSKYFQPGDNILSFHIIGNPLHDYTGFYMGSPYKIDYYQNLVEEKSERIVLILITLYLFVGLYHLLLFVRRPKEKFNLYFALFSIGLFFYLFLRTNTVFDLFANAYAIVRLEHIVLFLTVIPLLFFSESLLLGSIQRISIYYSAFAALLALLHLFVPIHVALYLLRIWQFILPLVVGYLAYRFIRSVGRQIKRTNAHYKHDGIAFSLLKSFQQTILFTTPGNIIIGVLIVSLTAVFDILDSIFFYTGIALTKYGFFLFVVGIVIALANRFLNVHQRVETLNATLEKKVAERTQQLQDTLTKVQQLKEQQDGDYFLTSLLVEPLIYNQARNESVRIDFLVKEKKEFKFRKWSKEIGGDLCMSQSLNLRGKDYTMFINADAMGKSIQGAGGILVLGSVLKFLMERTLVSPADNSLFPERWIRNAFVELQKVFESFNGSMLISAVLGLVDEESGLLYFINAEHPWTILYRDGRAQFIENQLTFHKIGTQGVASQIWIQTFQMQKGDIIIMGSDGRDDILLPGTSAEQEHIMNEDENLILTITEQAQGQLPAIKDHICNKGEITDDLSLLSITYAEESMSAKSAIAEPADQETFAQARNLFDRGRYQDSLQFLVRLNQKYQAHQDTLTLLVRTSLRSNRLEKVLEYAQKYYQYYPFDSKYIYLASYAAKKIRKYKLAADLGERYRLREPKNIKNLINLSDVYRNMGNKDRAFKMLQEAKQQDADNHSVQKLAKLLEASFV